MIASQLTVTDGKALSNLLRDANVSIMQATPITWRLLLDNGWTPHQPMKLLCGGEALSKELAGRLLTTHATLWNLYGPTETTIYSTFYHVTGKDITPTIPIGRPIANTQVYVLDSQLQPVPCGVPGELYIGGSGLARGYLQKTELNKERFIQNPFTTQHENQLYKTGDSVRYRFDGVIEYLGRLDYQVKMRGLRIELEEIEVILEEHPLVAQAIAMIRKDGAEEDRLIAYIRQKKEQDLSRDELHHYVSKYLPTYMLPSLYIFLDTFPQTSSGKVDRNALPLPKLIGIDPRRSFVAPSTPVEEILMNIWCDILGLKEISCKDNFFDLGGHSLLATRIISQVQEILGVKLPLRAIFEQPTIADMAIVVVQKQCEQISEEELANLLRELE